jgi:hypothetical protein
LSTGQTKAAPHPPQFFGSKLVSVHVPLQSVSGATHTQLPSVHSRAEPHVVPHAPQLPLSVFSLTQVPLQSERAVSVQVQTPVWHVVVPGQTIPQPPQFALLVAVSTQLRPHWVVVPGHWAMHAPALQNSPVAQATPHPPQLSGSLSVNTQLPPQSFDPPEHMHLAALQT